MSRSSRRREGRRIRDTLPLDLGLEVADTAFGADDPQSRLLHTLIDVLDDEAHSARGLALGNDAALLDWQRSAPYAEINHPTAEHFDPIFVARGAAAGEPGTRLHASYEFGSLSMNAYAFGM